MIATPSLLAAFDRPSAKPVTSEIECLQGAENEPKDGFSALIAQLAQIMPTPHGEGTGAIVAAEGEAGNPATGKILPVAGFDLAARDAGEGPGDALAAAAQLPVSVALTNSATIISFQRAPAGLAARQGEPIAAAAGGTVADQPPVAAKDASVAPVPRTDQIRMTVSVASAETSATRLSTPQDTTVAVEKQLAQSAGSLAKPGQETLQSGGQSDAQPRDQKHSGRDPQAAAPVLAGRSQSAHQATVDTEASPGDRAVQASGPEAANTSRTQASPDTAKPVAAAPEIAPANRADLARASAPVMISTMSSVENIERLVERLSIAREFDMAKTGSISVTHREFGALTVTFDNARAGLDVEIAAKDTDMQRALALAVSADRATSRGPELAQHSFQQTPNSMAGGSERGAGASGQGAASSGGNSADSGTQGERSPHQRDRDLASAAEDLRHSARPVAGDGALYA